MVAQKEGRCLFFVESELGWNGIERLQDIPAVRTGRVYSLDANSYFSRPGPRLIAGLEILAKVFHPTVQVSHEIESAIMPMTLVRHAAST